jgi:hypothetical protein
MLKQPRLELGLFSEKRHVMIGDHDCLYAITNVSFSQFTRARLQRFRPENSIGNLMIRKDQSVLGQST